MGDASMIRKSVRDVVEATLAKAPGSADARQDARAAGERLGDALVAHTEAAAEVPDAIRPLRGRAAKAGRLPSVGDSDGRARAFRAMAGVRL
jgi:hypothetical protein